MRNVADLVRSAAAAGAERPALLHGDQVMTWAELDRAADAVAGGLLRAGVGRGDRVALVLGNVPEFAQAYFGALRAGAVVVPVNTASTAAELCAVLADAGAKALFCGRSAADLLRGVRADLPALETVVVADLATGSDGVRAFGEFVAQGGPALDPVGGDGDLAVLLYTSGTSGEPKAAMLSHQALLANLDQLAAVEPPAMVTDDVVLGVLPLFHVYGLNATLGLAARTGAAVALVERFDPVDTLAAVERHRVTNVPGAPPMYVAWSLLPDPGRAFRRVRLAVSGSAPLPVEVLERLRDAGLEVREGYGLTEAAPVLTSSLLSDTVKPGSVGRPLPGVELRVVDEDGQDVEEDDPGEVVVRGPNLFSGYWPDGRDGPDAEGWFATGDLGYLDGDGDLFLVGRRKELVLVSGFNVYPREVEAVLLAHPDVEEAAVVPIPHPYTGESVKAYVVLRPGAQLSADDVVEHCARRLARFKCPTAVEFVPVLPHSATGKVARARLGAPDTW